MRDWGGEVGWVYADAVCSAPAGGVRRAGCVRFMVLAGSVLVCAVSLCGPGAVGIASALAAAPCPNEASRQGPSAELPECRVYEQVTPVDKGDATDIFGSHPSGNRGIAVDEGNEAYVAEGGNAILVHTDGSFARQTTALASSYVFSRYVEGWHMNVLAQSIAAPQEAGEEGPELYDPLNLSEVGFSELSGVDAVWLEATKRPFAVRTWLAPSVVRTRRFTRSSGDLSLNAEDYVEPIGASEDLSRVVMESKDHSLAPGAESQDGGTEALYETTGGECGATSDCRLVDVTPKGGRCRAGPPSDRANSVPVARIARFRVTARGSSSQLPNRKRAA